MSNTVQLTKNGQPIYPITDSSLVIGLKEGALMDSIIAYDGESIPVVSDIPSGVVVSYEGTDYTGTLAANSLTSGKIYLTPSSIQGEYDRYMVNAINGSYT